MVGDVDISGGFNILLGKADNLPERNPGNNRFHEIVKSFAASYHDLTQRSEKTLVVSTILAQIESEGGKFYKVESGKLVLVTDTRVAKSKIGHSLRDLRPTGTKGGKKEGRGSLDTGAQIELARKRAMDFRQGPPAPKRQKPSQPKKKKSSEPKPETPTVSGPHPTLAAMLFGPGNYVEAPVPAVVGQMNDVAALRPRTGEILDFPSIDHIQLGSTASEEENQKRIDTDPYYGSWSRNSSSSLARSASCESMDSLSLTDDTLDCERDSFSSTSWLDELNRTESMETIDSLAVIVTPDFARPLLTGGMLDDLARPEPKRPCATHESNSYSTASLEGIEELAAPMNYSKDDGVIHNMLDYLEQAYEICEHRDQ
eukprot:CAMPEP_0194035100 /NCGR_PEP_ID=MMETSP0009_2-20130614/7561_1 /TAXON_ID=210454 /ORGANISM="Grammatophora oceanica, Strain CCMP 410" /LENGTH=370 /DNA_ID=CAMNT_0038676331 /DNA_START=27 /DNA_END=1139 /DNA_ORIENTATION=+